MTTIGASSIPLAFPRWNLSLSYDCGRAWHLSRWRRQVSHRRHQDGRVRTGTYRAAGSAAIEVRSTTGAAIFRPVQADITINQAHPFMLGIWRANIMQGGLRWTVTIQEDPDGTYHYQGLTEDNGSCVFAEQQWQTTSAVTGKSNIGTYRIVDARNVEISDATGATLWRRR